MPDVTYDKKYGLLYCRIKPHPQLPLQSVTMADNEQQSLTRDPKSNRLRGEEGHAFSELTVVVDYDQVGDLAGVEILGLPAKKPT